MKIGKALVYLENFSETEDFDEELSLTVYDKTLYAQSLFSAEIDNVGINDEWKEELRKYKTGYYELTYEWDTENEYDDCGYVAYHYAIVVGIIELVPSFKARLCFIKYNYLDPVIDFVDCLVSKRWGVDFEYGGAGITSRDCYLPQALWRRFVSHHYKEPAWGPGYTAKLRKY